jgi:hypothetical protein
MKLAEALILRADAQKRIAELRQRLNDSALIQEGTEPPEDPGRLLAEVDRTAAELNALIKRINRTNITTAFDATRTLTDALADRDSLMLERGIITDVAKAASKRSDRFSRSEIKNVPTVDIAALQNRADDLARRHRELDSRIQQINWNTELLD